jgi:hypothetical protein
MIDDWENSLSIPCHCFLFRAYFFKELAISFDENLPNHEDWDCWMRIFAISKSVIFNKEILAVYRITESGMCSDHQQMAKGYVMALRKQMFHFKGNKYLKSKIQKRINLLLFRDASPNYFKKSLFFLKQSLHKIYQK